MKINKSYVQNLIVSVYQSNQSKPLKDELIIELIKIRDGRAIDMPSLELISKFENQINNKSSSAN
jgi:hypothetical protein